MSKPLDSIRAIRWQGDSLFLLDQRILPASYQELELTSPEQVAEAIRNMVVRGAPAIGITAAYGVVLAARHRYQQDADNWKSLIKDDIKLLSESRPTAVNLFWALDTLSKKIDSITGDPFETLKLLADEIHQQDLLANYRMAEYGASLIKQESASVLTHCNAGALATGGYGTALGVIRQAYSDGRINHVYADETRPWLQGARLTAWEMVQDKIPVTLLAEGAAASLMKQAKVSWVIVGSDRIAANGDVANKIGTYALAVLARHHGVRFMVAAPTSTVDMNMPNGEGIPIEQRSAEEVLFCGGTRVAAEGAQAWNPAFDVTPAELVDAIVTEKGVVEQPTLEKMQHMMAR